MWRPASRGDTNNCEFVEIYNSNPWFQDISAYQIVCADNSGITPFPLGTVIPGGGFLVVAASPGSLQKCLWHHQCHGPL